RDANRGPHRPADRLVGARRPIAGGRRAVRADSIWFSGGRRVAEDRSIPSESGRPRGSRLQRDRRGGALTRIRRGVYLFPTLLTLANLAAGITSIIFAANDHFTSAAWAIIAGIIMDMLDGRVARWANATSEVGLELDSLCDAVTFGIAPAILMYQVALSPLGRPAYAGRPSGESATWYIKIAGAIPKVTASQSESSSRPTSLVAFAHRATRPSSMSMMMP